MTKPGGKSLTNIMIADMTKNAIMYSMLIIKPNLIFFNNAITATIETQWYCISVAKNQV